MTRSSQLLEKVHGLMTNQPQDITEPLRIVLVSAGPKDASRMRLDEEIREIKRSIKLGPFRHLFSVEVIFASRQNDLREALLEFKPHILHFSGHGSEAGILLEDGAGKKSLFEFEQLGQLLAAFHDNVRLVVLNACHSAAQAESLRQIVDHVIGMNHQIRDDSAVAFSSALYLDIGYGRHLQACFSSALSALRTAQVEIPELHSRDGINPQEIYPLSWVVPKAVPEPPPIVPHPADTPGTLQLEITVLPHDARKAKCWRYTCNEEQEFFESIDDQKTLLTPEQMWQHVAYETSENRQGFHTTGIAPPDVLLMLRDNLILNLYPERTVENIIRQLRQAALETNFYVVCDQEVPFNTLYQKKYESVLDGWFRTLIMSGVTDLIELPRNQESTATCAADVLRACAKKSQQRRERLRRLASADDWAIELRPEAKLLKRFLERFAEGDFGAANGKNLAVFYDQRPKFGWSELLKNSRERNSNGKWFIGAHTSGKNISDLSELWIQESTKKTPELFDGIFEFQGMFEWLYAVCRLQLAVRLARQTSPGLAGKALF